MSQQTWDLNEFDQHLQRLDAVLTSVRTCESTGQSAGTTGGLMYGLLPSPLIVPGMLGVHSSTMEVLKGLVEVNEAGREGIQKTRDLNADTEATNADHAQEIQNLLDTLEAKY